MIIEVAMGLCVMVVLVIALGSLVVVMVVALGSLMLVLIASNSTA